MRRSTRVAAVLQVVAILAVASPVVCALAQAPQAAASPPQAEARSPHTADRSAHVPDEVVLNGTTVGKRVPPKPGDICVVCNHPLEGGDVVFQVRGQRMPVHLEEWDANLPAQLERLLAQLEPRGAFIGAGPNQPALSEVWFFAGFCILLGLVFAALCAHRALHMGRSPVAWFGIGLVLNAFGYLLLLTRPGREVLAPAGVPGGLRKIAATYAPELCAGCGTLNHPSASACSGCGGKLEPRTVSEVVRAGLRPV